MSWLVNGSIPLRALLDSTTPSFPSHEMWYVATAATFAATGMGGPRPPGMGGPAPPGMGGPPPPGMGGPRPPGQHQGGPRPPPPGMGGPGGPMMGGPGQFRGGPPPGMQGGRGPGMGEKRRNVSGVDVHVLF